MLEKKYISFPGGGNCPPPPPPPAMYGPADSCHFQVAWTPAILFSAESKKCFSCFRHKSVRPLWENGLENVGNQILTITFERWMLRLHVQLESSYSQTSVKRPSIKRTPDLKRTLIKFPKSSPLTFCKFDLY